jgi:acetolactate synthase-1/2/3 large subunit
MLVVGSRLRSNETLRYQLKLPAALYRIDANALAHNRGYPSDYFVQGDALATLHALADRLEGRMAPDPALLPDVQRARQQAVAHVNGTLGPYQALQDGLAAQAAQAVQNGSGLWWVRDITLSNSMWGNRAPQLNHPRAGVHALGGGIGQGLAMAIGASVADRLHGMGRKTVALVGDGGFMLNVGELACAAQERAPFVLLLMNDGGYGVIKNIQDDLYGSRHCYVDLHTPDFAQLCASLQVAHLRLSGPEPAPQYWRRPGGWTGRWWWRWTCGPGARLPPSLPAPFCARTDHARRGADRVWGHRPGHPAKPAAHAGPAALACQPCGGAG